MEARLEDLSLGFSLVPRSKMQLSGLAFQRNAEKFNYLFCALSNQLAGKKKP